MVASLIGLFLSFWIGRSLIKYKYHYTRLIAIFSCFFPKVQIRGGGSRVAREQRSEGNAADLVLKDTATHIAQSNLTRVTGVEVNQTESGLELILETVAGSERLVPLIQPVGNDLVIDILDATLAFSIRTGIEELNPASGISRVTVNQVNENSIRVIITGENQTPSAELVPGRDDLILSITPDGTTAESEPEEEIEVIATGEAEDEDDYFVPDASRTLKTDIPLRDTPASVQVIPQQVIKDQGATNVREIVRNASGVTFSNSAGGRSEQFIIRGFIAERFRNGFRDDLFSTRTQAELANIDRVEILKGPASVLFGRAEPSGIINLVTKQPLREPFYELAFTAGNFDFYRPTLDFSGPLTENGNLAYRLNAAYENAGSFRDGVETERFFVAPTLSWQIGDDTELTLEYSYLNDTRPIDDGLVVLSDNEVANIPFDSFLGDPDIRVDLEENRTELYLDHRFNSNLSLRSLLRYTTATDSRAGATSGIIGGSEDERNFPVGEGGGNQFYETFTFQNDLTVKFDKGSIKHTVLFGLEYTTRFFSFEAEARPSGTIDIFNPSAFEPSTDVPFQLIAIQEFRDDTFGIYLQDQIAILDNLQFVIGGRFDTYSSETDDLVLDVISETEADVFSPRVGIVYQPIEPVSLYASYTRSFTPVSGTGVNNEPFDPERGTGFEIGVKTEIIKDRLSSTLAFYDTTLTNVTTEDPDNPNFDIQTGEQNSRGIELDLTGEIVPGWNIFAGYAYTDATVTEDNVIPVGNRLNNVPEHNFNLWTAYTLQKGSLAGLGFGTGIFYIGERAGDLDNSFFVDGYTRVDAAIYYEKENYRAALNFKNLFDAEFIEGTQSRTTVNPGAPFTVQGTVSVEF
ncbi:TonB-dependent siderophore receptor [Hyella patelloides LEGE 07179]|uniref:TonB-dependent siderophore receptor n=2 Tax=Hyella TaxID=945733 RepID=A0A563VQ62_9CYAN|nr:TonB-dependent siderophore receptor [Hyella patelloides LEGE 07179]